MPDAPPIEAYEPLDGLTVARPALPLARPAPLPPGTTPLPVEVDAYRARLSETFGYPDFRGGQERVLRALGERDVVAVMPTGTGKSLCFVLPALEVGRTLVVSPLIALMQDQVEGLQSAGVSATFINSNFDRMEQNRRYQAFVNGQINLLYVAPERFQNPLFTDGLRRAGVNLLAIDEAHCISEWGHNFRPDYLLLGGVRERLGNPRTLALTATANPRVRQDIARGLGIERTAEHVVTTVDRPNLVYRVESIASKEDRLRWLEDFARSHGDSAGIVYSATRAGVEETAARLVAAGVRAEPYHAGLPRQVRTETQRRFTLGETPVVVATVAFGMGIDKPDVRYVVHMNLPPRLEAYTQEAGRGGRDGDPAECVLLYAPADLNMRRRHIFQAHPDEEAVRRLWQRWLAVADPQDGRLPPEVAEDEQFAIAVSALRESGLLDAASLRVTSWDPRARIDVSGIERHRIHALTCLKEMATYAETEGCRRALVLRYFGEQPPERCGSCDNCRRPARTERRAPPERAAAPSPRSPRERRPAAVSAPPETPHDPALFDALSAWRREQARKENVPAYVIASDRTLREIAAQKPPTKRALLGVWGLGEARVERLGDAIMEIVGRRA
ncbi:MAG: RecQ family ATP-dependent DNA helicase [Chloroflexi bacterium]|nr:RecQ family ATP-dependent DNA helicase [Chloroflexota bacterium]